MLKVFKFRISIYEEMINNDEMWFIYQDKNAFLIYDLPLFDV